MSNIEKIKAAIERRITDNTFGAKLELIDLLAFIDSLPEEKLSEDLEEAAEELFETIEVQEHENIFEDTFKKIFIAGVEWQKKQMMKDAVEGEVIYDLGGFFRIKSEAIDGAKYKVGSWVKLIIVKED